MLTMETWGRNKANIWVAKIVVSILFVCGLGLWGVTAFASASINNIRIAETTSGFRVVFDLDGKVEHKLFMLDEPHRLVIDMNDTRLNIDPASVKYVKTPIRNIRSATRNKKDLRIVFDLDSAIKTQSFLLPKNNQYGDRLVVDLKSQQSKVAAAPVSVDTRLQSQRDLIIAIDPGHGGEDPGAVGINHTHEKNVVLSISQKLAKLFEKEKGYKAILMREGDYFVTLAGRRELARKEKADMFISIHADSFTNNKANGASVFTLSSKGASSATARFLAERENKADMVGGVSLIGKDDILSSVLVDLSMTYKMESSYDVGEAVLERIKKITRLHSTRVEKAGFAVLKTPDIPSILVETGFMSNRQDAKKLTSTHFQQKMAAAIFDGVNHYFQQKAPEGTYIAAKFRHNRALSYTVERGDSLSQIAFRYNVSMKQLMQLNNLGDETLQIGQTLKIP